MTQQAGFSLLLILTGVGLLGLAVWGRSLPMVLQQWRQRRQANRMGQSSPADGQMPPLTIIPMWPLIGAAFGASIVTSFGIGWLIDHPLIALGLFPCWAILTLMGIYLVEQRHQRQIDQQIVDVATRVASSMQGGVPLLQALQRMSDVPKPLGTAWQWMMAMTGAPIMGASGEQRYLTLGQVARTLANTTPNRLLGMFLNHLEAASSMTQEDARDRLQAAADALHASRLRLAELRSKLTHARASALMVVGIGAGLALFLSIAMGDRFIRAFQSPFGPVVGTIVVLLYLLPIGGILVLSRVPAVDL